MLIEFTVENYLSFKEQNIFSMIATKDKSLNEKQTIEINSKNRILKNVAIYGANASGKSNLLKAIQFMKMFVINSSKESQQGDAIEVEAFKFNTMTEKKASSFEVVFFHNETIYRYGFEVIRDKVISEWLFARYSIRESQLFVRNGQEIIIGDKFREGKKYQVSVRENALFLSVCAQFNGTISSEVMEWFRNMHVISSLENDYVSVAFEILENKDGNFDVQKESLISLITGIDVGIQDVVISENEFSNIESLFKNLPKKLAEEIKEQIKIRAEAESDDKKSEFKVVSQGINTVHKRFNENKKFVSNEICDFDIESKGTKKIFELAGPIIDTMFNGGILFIDELQNSLHATLVLGLINFFINSKLNNRAQFIFTTHDVNILSANILRRDEFWFVEKNEFGESEITCLVDFEEHVRKDAHLEKDYLKGRYGAIPYLRIGE
jgi:hypothetical protein